VLLSLAAGLVAFGVAKLFTTWQIAALIGWIVAAIVFISWIWLNVRGMDGEATARHAAIEDASRPTADLILILASVASLVGVGLALLEASSRPASERAIITAVAAITVTLSWATVHTVFTLRYARLYYAAGGGIDFHEDRPPAYGDFAYPGLHDRDDLSGLRHHDRLEDDPPDGPVPRVHVLHLRDRRGGDDDQRGREPAQPVAPSLISNEPDISETVSGRWSKTGSRYIGLTSWK